jgi:hypothetical protein
MTAYEAKLANECPGLQAAPARAERARAQAPVQRATPDGPLGA